jgi:phosphoglycolate phosphatase
LNAALVEHRLEPLSEDAVRAFIGPPIHMSFQTLTGTHDVDSYVDTYHRIYAETCVDVVVLDGMRAALETLAARFQLVLATSKPVPFTESILRAHGLQSLFTGTSAPTIDAPSEPKTATVGRALERARAGDVLALVGDTHFDVDAGRDHDLPVIGVTWGFGSEAELRSAGASAIVHDAPELVAVVERFAARRRNEGGLGHLDDLEDEAEL